MPDIADDEKVTRFITQSGWVRADKTLRQDGFIPSTNPEIGRFELSVTCHGSLSDAQLWSIGHQIVAGRQQATNLHGRADFLALVARRLSLQAIPDPVAENPNHSVIINWPADKAQRKHLAQLLAKEVSAGFIAISRPPPPV